MKVADDEFDEVVEMIDGDISLSNILPSLVMLRLTSILRAYINHDKDMLQDDLMLTIPISTYAILCDELPYIQSYNDVNDYLSICQNQIEYEIMFLQMDTINWQLDKYTNRLYNKGNAYQSCKVLERNYEIGDDYFTIQITPQYALSLLMDSLTKQQDKRGEPVYE